VLYAYEEDIILAGSCVLATGSLARDGRALGITLVMGVVRRHSVGLAGHAGAAELVQHQITPLNIGRCNQLAICTGHHETVPAPDREEQAVNIWMRRCRMQLERRRMWIDK
jgi:hypothetical protein